MNNELPVKIDAVIFPHDYVVKRLILWAIPPWIKPNHITFLRFLLTFPVVLLVLYKYYNWAAMLFFITALTDMIDGSLARTRNQITEWGELFDPIADKLLIGSVGLLLIYRFLHWLLIVIILGLEFITVFAVFLYKWRDRTTPISANIYGKTKMILQSLGIVLLFVFAHMPTNRPLSWVISAIFIISIFFTLLSMRKVGI